VVLAAGIAGLFLLPTPWNVVAVCVAALVEVGEVAFWLRFLRRYRVQTGAEGMRGQRGEVIEDFAGGRGRVRVYGEIWAARAVADLRVGERVRVRAVDGLTLRVEPDDSAGT
jgi:membrane protein implicated in regulation of membrane protease activity